MLKRAMVGAMASMLFVGAAHAELELLLENYHREISTLTQEAGYLRKTIQSGQDMMTIALDAYRGLAHARRVANVTSDRDDIAACRPQPLRDGDRPVRVTVEQRDPRTGCHERFDNRCTDAARRPRHDTHLPVETKPVRLSGVCLRYH